MKNSTRSIDLWDELEWRGLIADSTKAAELRDHLRSGERTAYVGFDPTADSLHIGSLLPLLVLRRVQEAGHRPIVLIGGGTGLIGDPSGKLGERQLNPEEQVAVWSDRLKEQVKGFLDFDRAILTDNYEWLSKLQVVSFLRDVGKHFPLGGMIAKESVRSRMTRSDEGISYTEFSYQILQAYDFMALHERYGCTLQLGGSDQWGNITAGVELIRRVKGEVAFGMTLPLVAKSDGTKFGKTESGTVWLSSAKTSPYEMYQFWVNAADDDVVTYLKYFTFLNRSDVEALAEGVRSSPEKREAQRILAREVTRLVHGVSAATDAEHITRALFDGQIGMLTENQLEQVCRSMAAVRLDAVDLKHLDMLGLLTRMGVAGSKREARDLISAGAIHINGQRLVSATDMLRRDIASFGRFLIVRKGKKSYHAAEIV